MRVLCVAEKPSIAKSISQILSGGQFETRNSPSTYNKNYVFQYPQTNSTYTVTSVSGHLSGCDFGEEHRKWHSCDPAVLFDVRVNWKTTSDAEKIERNIRAEARNAEMVMIWTDCDREGEYIGAEIVKVCRQTNARIQVKRARFSAIIAQQIHRAAQNPVNLDQRQVDAVEARIELDLKIGSAFTRMQTMTLQGRVNAIDSLVSYGPCQFPTLGFVVRRWMDVQNFRPETFWYIYLALIHHSESGGEQEVKFTSRRGQIFDEDVAIAIYEFALTHELAAVTKCLTKETKKFKPLPLTTVELQKAGSRLLKLSPKKVLEIAEKLYQRGFLSYPRTETDQYDNQFDFKSLIEKQKQDAGWGGFATGLYDGDGFETPRKGKHNDKAHPPIHPTSWVGNLVGDEKRVYEFVTRRFLACCSKDAVGMQTTVEVVYGGEEFYATGLRVIARNYLGVYVYDKWADHEIPEFRVDQVFRPSVCELRDGQTSSPKYLTEADLVTLMDKNGIGTDATIAQHIATIIDRDYVVERLEGQTKHLVPSTLGIGLIQGYDEVGLESSLSKPALRRETERDMVRICEGTKTKEEMLHDALEKYKEMFDITRRQFGKVVESVQRYISGNGNPRGDGDGGDPRPPPGGGNGGGMDDDNNDNAPPPNRRRGGRDPGGGPGGHTGNRRRGTGRDTRTAPPPIDIPSDDNDEDMAPPPPPLAPIARQRTPTQLPRSRSRQPDVGPPPPQTHVPSLLTTSAAPSSGTTGPNCRCDKPAVQRTVQKDGGNKGRKFWRCGSDQDCNYFLWDDEAGTQPQSVVPTKRSHLSGQPARQCQCGDAVMRTVTKESVNKGRQFWACPNENRSEGQKGCSFFEWADEQPGPSTLPGASSQPLTGRTNDTCYKCNKTGHWASNCPSADSAGPSKRAKTFGSSGTDNKGNCYKCGNSGHFSKDCPKPGTSYDKSSQSTSGDQNCYKCGQAGHWSNACPGGGEGSRGRSDNSYSKSDRGGKRGQSRGGGKAKGKTKKTSKYKEASEFFA